MKSAKNEKIGVKQEYKMDTKKLAVQLRRNSNPLLNSLVLDGASQFLSESARMSSNMIEFLVDMGILIKK